MNQAESELPEVESFRGRTIIVSTIMVVLILLNWYLFQQLLGLNYFMWYVEIGIFISIFMGVFALTWKDPHLTEGLSSLNPREYTATCALLVATYMTALSEHFYSIEDRKEESIVIYSWDLLITVIWGIVLSVGLMVWVFVIAPLNYLVTIISGAPARQYLRGATGVAVIRKMKDDSLSLDYGSSKEKINTEYIVSLISNPFATTQALTVLVLWIIKFILDFLE
jgi:hypothetical protein